MRNGPKLMVGLQEFLHHPKDGFGQTMLLVACTEDNGQVAVGKECQQDQVTLKSETLS